MSLPEHCDQLVAKTEQLIVENTRLHRELAAATKREQKLHSRLVAVGRHLDQALETLRQAVSA